MTFIVQSHHVSHSLFSVISYCAPGHFYILRLLENGDISSSPSFLPLKKGDQITLYIWPMLSGL